MVYGYGMDEVVCNNIIWRQDPPLSRSARTVAVFRLLVPNRAQPGVTGRGMQYPSGLWHNVAFLVLLNGDLVVSCEAASHKTHGSCWDFPWPLEASPSSRSAPDAPGELYLRPLWPWPKKPGGLGQDRRVELQLLTLA